MIIGIRKIGKKVGDFPLFIGLKLVFDYVQTDTLLKFIK